MGKKQEALKCSSIRHKIGISGGASVGTDMERGGGDSVFGRIVTKRAIKDKMETPTMQDDDHEAYGAMIHRGLVEQRQAKAEELERNFKDLQRDYARLRQELINEIAENKRLRQLLIELQK